MIPGARFIYCAGHQIEDCFRIMKFGFNGRPVNHRLRERIRAHFLLCYTALPVFRLLETRLNATAQRAGR